VRALLCIGEAGLVVAHNGVASGAERAGEGGYDRVGRLERRDEEGGQGSIAGRWCAGGVRGIEYVGERLGSRDAEDQMIGDVLGFVFGYDRLADRVDEG